jgi:hypothetical protein
MQPSLKQMLLTAPETQLDHQMFPLIEKWDDEPTSLQLLEVLDQCIYFALASGFVITLLQNMYDLALEREGKTHEDDIPFATWRTKLEGL